MLTHLQFEHAKEVWWFSKYFSYESIFLKIFEGRMLIRGETTYLLQIFCELLLYSQAIFKSLEVADNTF